MDNQPGFCLFCNKPVKYDYYRKQFKKFCSAECRSNFNKNKIVENQQKWLEQHNLTFPVFCSFCKTNVVKWNNKKQQFNKFCSVKCATNSDMVKQKIKQTNLQRYGVEYPQLNENIRQKSLQTNLEKFGCEYPSSTEKIKQKTKQTNLERYGVENPFCSDEIKQKIKRINLEKYGTENPFQSELIKQKIKQTNLQKYGVENPSQHESIKQKTQQTSIQKYGTCYPTQSETIKQKIKQTNLQRYGVEYVSQDLLFKEKVFQTFLKKYDGFPFNSTYLKQKIFDTCIAKYGTPFHVQSHIADVLPMLNSFEWLYDQYVVKKKPSTQIAYELKTTTSTVCRYLCMHNIDRIYFYKFSFSAILWLDTIAEKQNVFIQHALNSKEYRIPGTRYRVDGFCKQTNTVYEFYGDRFHGNLNIFKENDKCHPFNKKVTAKQLYEKTMEREYKLKQLGYNVVSIWENDFHML